LEDKRGVALALVDVAREVPAVLDKLLEFVVVWAGDLGGRDLRLFNDCLPGLMAHLDGCAQALFDAVAAFAAGAQERGEVSAAFVFLVELMRRYPLDEEKLARLVDDIVGGRLAVQRGLPMPAFAALSDPAASLLYKFIRRAPSRGARFCEPIIEWIPGALPRGMFIMMAALESWLIYGAVDLAVARKLVQYLTPWLAKLRRDDDFAKLGVMSVLNEILLRYPAAIENLPEVVEGTGRLLNTARLLVQREASYSMQGRTDGASVLLRKCVRFVLAAALHDPASVNNELLAMALTSFLHCSSQKGETGDLALLRRFVLRLANRTEEFAAVHTHINSALDLLALNRSS
jgi:hypothetical protein